MEHVSIPDEKRVRHANREQNCHSAQIHRGEVGTALGGARQLDRESEPEQEREDGIELSCEKRIDDPLRGFVPPCGERIEARRPGVAGTRGARQVDGKNAEQCKASQHVEDNDAFFRLDGSQGIRRGDG